MKKTRPLGAICIDQLSGSPADSVDEDEVAVVVVDTGFGVVDEVPFVAACRPALGGSCLT